MEDGDPASNDQRYLPDFDGSCAISGYDEYLAMEQQMSSFEQLHAWYNGPSLASSMSPPVHVAQSWVPDRYPQELYNDLLSSDMCELNPSSWLPPFFNGLARIDTTRVYQDISLNATTDVGLYPQTITSLMAQSSLPVDMHYDIPYVDTLVEDHGCEDPSLDTSYYTLPTSSDFESHTYKINFDDALVQGIGSGSSDSYVATPAGSTDCEWPRLPRRATDPLNQPMDLEPSHNRSPCVSYGSFHAPAPVTSTWLAPATQSTACSVASSAPTQALPIRGKPTKAKRKRHILDVANLDRSLWEAEKHISKRARIPQSSVNILSFGDRDESPSGRGRREESAKQDMQALALVGGSCTHCVRIKKKCDVQVPCAMCAKFWNRYSTGTLPKAKKRIDRVSPDRSSDVALRTKLALRQIYDEITAVRDSALSLPKLLSIIDGLKPSQKRLMQSLLMHLPRTIRQDLGCYFYIVMIMGRTQSIQRPSSETRSPRDILDQWNVLEASALFSAYSKSQMARCSDHHTFECHIAHYFFGVHTPRTVCATHKLKKTDELLEEMYIDLQNNNWPPRCVQASARSRRLDRLPGNDSLPPLLENTMGCHFNLSPSCPNQYIDFAPDDTCVYRYETASGSYIILVDSESTLYQAGTLIAPFLIERNTPFTKWKQATGWLTIPSIRPLQWGVPILDGWARIITAHSTKSRAARWWKIPSLRYFNRNCNSSRPSDLHPTICSDELRRQDVLLARYSLHMMIKSEPTKWELKLESELQQLKAEHGGCPYGSECLRT